MKLITYFCCYANFKIFLLILALQITATAGAQELGGIRKSLIDDFIEKNSSLTKQVSSPLEGDQWIKALMATGRFERVSQFHSESGLKIVAEPLLRANKIIITGASQISLNELRSLVPIEEGEKFDRRKFVKFGSTLKKYYGDRGFFNTTVDLEFKKIEKNQIQINITIVEGLPCLVDVLQISSENQLLNQRLSTRLIKLTQKPLTQDHFEKITEEVNSYLTQKRFLRAQLGSPIVTYNEERDRATITLPIQQPFSYQIFFSGYDFFTKSDLYKMIRSETLRTTQIRPKSDLAEKIKEQYRKEGFPNTEVRVTETINQESFIKRLQFEITEGARVKIVEWELKGRLSRSAQFYISRLKQESSGALRRGYYNKEDLDQSIQALISNLRNEGFLRARLQSFRLDFLSEDRVRLYVNFDEGPLTIVTRIQFNGNLQVAAEELMLQLGVEPNSALRIKEFEAGLDRLQKHYQESGFLEMRILNKGPNLIKYNERGTQAQVNIELYEGPKIKVKAIITEGNTFTRDRVIISELDFSVGDVLTPKNLEESLIRLNRLGIFSRVNIQMLEENSEVSERTLIVKVEERDPGIYRLGLGLNSERKLTARGFTSLSYNNLSGTARSVTGRVELQSNVADINYLEHRATLSYLEPFLFSTRTRGRVTLTRTDEVFNNFIQDPSTREITQIITSDRLDFKLERELSRNYQLFLTLWSIDNRRERERNGFCSNADDGVLCPGTVQTISLVGPTFDIDFRDNSFLPTRGLYSRLSFNYSHPTLGSSELIEFFRTEGVFNYYIPILGPKLVWANSLGGGYVANLSNRPGSGVPTRYAFFLGGAQTVRGFEFTSTQDRIPNNDELPLTTGNELIIPQDTHYALIKSEMRWTIVGEHGAVLFYDGGLVKVTGRTFKKPYRHAAGIGYRYNTPVGPVRLDVGFKLDRQRPEGQKPEQLYRFHFAIGTF